MCKSPTYHQRLRAICIQKKPKEETLRRDHGIASCARAILISRCRASQRSIGGGATSVCAYCERKESARLGSQTTPPFPSARRASRKRHCVRARERSSRALARSATRLIASLRDSPRCPVHASGRSKEYAAACIVCAKQCFTRIRCCRKLRRMRGIRSLKLHAVSLLTWRSVQPLSTLRMVRLTVIARHQ